LEFLNLNHHIELTTLSPTLTIRDIDRTVEEATEHGMAAICVPPFWVKRASRELGSRTISLVTVIGFPLGYNMTETKLDEIRRGFDNGADEADVVMNLTSFKTGIPWTKIEIAKCAKLAHDHQKLLTVTIETGFLNDGETIGACKLCCDAGADFIKTSTGFSAGPAVIKLAGLIRSAVPVSVGVKIPTEVISEGQADALFDAGVSRIAVPFGSKLIPQTPIHTNHP
jgi:deoxyribose-phosphate aldolase